MMGFRRGRRPLHYVVPLGVGALAGALGVAAYTTRELNGPVRRTWRDDFTFSPFEVQVDFEPVSFRTDDGVTLRGWWFTRPASDRVIVGCTGHRGTKQDLLGIGSGLWRAGSNVLLFDYRGCGESDTAPLSVGHNEQADLRAAVGFARERLPGGRIGIVGYSMGGALAILTAATDPSVRAVVTDCAYASLREVVAHAYRRRRVPAQLLALTDLLNQWRHGYSLAALRPVDVVGAIAPRPILIIHGGADMVTPVEQGRQLYAAAGEPKELWIVSDVPHCGAYFADRRGYVERVAAFFDRALTGGAGAVAR